MTPRELVMLLLAKYQLVNLWKGIMRKGRLVGGLFCLWFFLLTGGALTIVGLYEKGVPGGFLMTWRELQDQGLVVQIGFCVFPVAFLAGAVYLLITAFRRSR